MTVTLRKINKYPKIFKMRNFTRYSMITTKQILILTTLDFLQPYVPEVVKSKQKHIQGQKTAVKLMLPHCPQTCRAPYTDVIHSHCSTYTHTAHVILYKPKLFCLKWGGDQCFPTFKRAMKL